MKTVQIDVAIIGAGSAGLPAYRAAKAAGSSAILIEGGPHGTTCARVGCMPSKLLVAAAEVAHQARNSEPFGVRCSVDVDGRAVLDRVRSERDRFVGFVIASVAAIREDHRIHGYARFVAPGELEIAPSTRVRARAIVIATGSSPMVPPLFDEV